MAGGLLARADRDPAGPAARSALLAHRWLLVPLCSLLAAIALFFAITAPHTDPGTDIASLLSQGGDYNSPSAISSTSPAAPWASSAPRSPSSLLA